MMASSTSDVTISAKKRVVHVRQCVYVWVLSLKDISPPIVYVVTYILSSLKGQLTCGSRMSVAVISEEMINRVPLCRNLETTGVL